MSAIVTIAIGSNIQQRYYIPLAIRRLSDFVTITHYSNIYYTQPVGFIDQPDFYNMCLRGTTRYSANELKHTVLRAIESECDRVRTSNPNSPRTIDLDIILYNQLIIESKTLTIPDPDICRHAHVSVPLADIAPDEIHPLDGRSFKEIATPYIAEFHKRIVDLPMDFIDS